MIKIDYPSQHHIASKESTLRSKGLHNVAKLAVEKAIEESEGTTMQLISLILE